MVTEFVTKDSGVRKEFDSGMRRDDAIGKPRYDLIEESMLERWALLMGRGAEKYSENNWKLADSTEELNRFKSSAMRHMMQWKSGVDIEEDHAAAILFNVTAAEFVANKLGLDINGETWFGIPNVGKYQVSQSGKVRNKQTGRLLAQWKNCWGYSMVSFFNEPRRHYQVHRLVMTAIIGEVEDLQVNHMDGDKQNNDISNLEYCTSSQNHKHAIATGLRRPAQVGKITFQDAEAIRLLVDGGAKQTDVAVQFGLSAQGVNSIVKGRSWKKDLNLER